VRLEHHVLVLRSSLRRHDRALPQEDVADADSLIQQASRVVAEIEDQAPDVLFFLEAEQFLLEIPGGVTLEVGDTEIGETGGEERGLDGMDRDDIPDQGHRPQLIFPLTLDGDIDLGPPGAAQPFDRLVR